MTGKQLVQGCYVVAWVGIEATTFKLLGRTRSTEPRHPVVAWCCPICRHECIHYSNKSTAQLWHMPAIS